MALIKKPLTEHPYLQMTIQAIWHGHVLDPPILPHKKVERKEGRMHGESEDSGPWPCSLGGHISDRRPGDGRRLFRALGLEGERAQPADMARSWAGDGPGHGSSYPMGRSWSDIIERSMGDPIGRGAGDPIGRGVDYSIGRSVGYTIRHGADDTIRWDASGSVGRRAGDTIRY